MTATSSATAYSNKAAFTAMRPMAASSSVSSTSHLPPLCLH